MAVENRSSDESAFLVPLGLHAAEVPRPSAIAVVLTRNNHRVLAAAPLFLTFFNAVHSVFVKERHDRSFVEGAYF